jgi:hypothetical protein
MPRRKNSQPRRKKSQAEKIKDGILHNELDELLARMPSLKKLEADRNPKIPETLAYQYA